MCAMITSVFVWFGVLLWAKQATITQFGYFLYKAQEQGTQWESSHLTEGVVHLSVHGLSLKQFETLQI